MVDSSERHATPLAKLPDGTQVNVTQKNNNPSRDGLYIDAAFTPTNAANLTRDMGFNGAV